MGNQATAMPPKKSKEAIAKAAAGSGGKSKKKKWSKGKTKDKVQSHVLFNQDLYKKIVADVPKQRVITVANIADKFKVNGALARKTIAHLHEKGLIREVKKHNSILIYTRAIGGEGEGDDAQE